MKLETEVTVAVAPEQAWRALTDVAGLLDALPAAELRNADGVYTGRVDLEVDGRRIPVEAALRPIDEDTDEGVATIELSGRQLDGPGVGSVLLSTRLEPAESGARVHLSADIRSSGHAPASATFEAAADRLLGEIAQGLRARALSQPAPAAAEPGAMREPDLEVAASPSTTPPSVAAGRRKRGALVAAGAGAVLVVAMIRVVRRARR
jgi:carbon monoxide dehydrogenase subunit G